MFIIKSNEDKEITWPVTVETAVDGGAIKKYEFTGKFKLLNDDQREAFAEQAKDAEDGVAKDGGAWKETSIDNIMRVMTGWANVTDENKTPIEFSRDTLRSAARGAHGIGVLRGINQAIIEITTGARTKN